MVSTINEGICLDCGNFSTVTTEDVTVIVKDGKEYSFFLSKEEALEEMSGATFSHYSNGRKKHCGCES